MLSNPALTSDYCHHDPPRPTLAAAERLLLGLGGMCPHVVFYVPLETLVTHLEHYHAINFMIKKTKG